MLCKPADTRVGRPNQIINVAPIVVERCRSSLLLKSIPSLVIGIGLGVSFALDRRLGARLRPLHVELNLWGWATLLIYGMACHTVPRFCRQLAPPSALGSAPIMAGHNWRCVSGARLGWTGDRPRPRALAPPWRRCASGTCYGTLRRADRRIAVALASHRLKEGRYLFRTTWLMPLITRTMIKMAMVYALAGSLLSALWLVEIVWPIHPILRLIQPTALHLIVMGWLTQLIFGIALWMFPPWSRQHPRGPSLPSWLCFGLLNGGLLLRLIAEPLNAVAPTPFLGWLLVISAVLQVIAIMLFVGLTWSRVRLKGSLR